MGEVIFMNGQARQYFKIHGIVQPKLPLECKLELVGKTTKPTEITENWATIEKASTDPDLVACIELQRLGFTEVDMSDERKNAIARVGLSGVKEDILKDPDININEADFEIAVAHCEEAVRERYGLDGQAPYGN